jgi:hypothetical protein
MNPSDKKPDQKNDQTTPATERAGERKRDEQRSDAGPQYGGEAWDVADERGDDRFGHARNDDAEPLEQAKRDPDVRRADEKVEAGPEQAGMGRGEVPRKPKSRSNKNG